MTKFLSCDWGTSTFRLRLVEVAGTAIIAEENSQKGIADTYARWKEAGSDPTIRQSFYLAVITEHIRSIEQKLNTSLDNIPLVISGMASASIGMIELPYQVLPFAIDGSNALVHTIEAGIDFLHRVFIISGIRTEDDVMRGEETQLIGASQTTSASEENLFIFPGTHSKHVIVKDNKIKNLITYMTGEIFDLLSKKSVLSLSLEAGGSLDGSLDQQAFENGVRESVQSNLLHTSFLIRTNDLFKKWSRQENYYYLSGLLIGTELNGLPVDGFSSITLVSDPALSSYYLLALQTLGIKNVRCMDANEAAIRGQVMVLHNSLRS